MPTRVSTLEPLIAPGAVFEVTELVAPGLPAGAVWGVTGAAGATGAGVAALGAAAGVGVAAY
jgi:hypothetical protein